MPRRRIEMKKIREVLRLRYGRGASVREIASSCSLSTSTVSEYLYRSGAAGYTWPLPEGLSDEDLERELFPPRPAKDDPPRPLPDFADLRRELSRKGTTLLLLWREYKAREPDGYGYSRFAELFAEWEKRTDLRMLQRHKAGEKLFVDYAGVPARWTDPETGEVRQAPVFVSALGSSQMIYARACESEDSRSWLSAHVEAFEFYGALPHVLVPDNLKTGVSSPCRYEPTLNPAYAELARFYELTVLPARVRKPRDKAKVENAVQQVERWVLAPLRDRTFLSLSELNEAIAAQVGELNARVMRGPNASREDLFREVDKPAMRPLPDSRFSFAEWKTAKVAPDYHVEFEGHRYSVPYGFVGRKVDLRAGANVIEVFCGSKRVASHPRSLSRRGFTTQPAHMPPQHSAAEWTPERLARWAQGIGTEVALFASRVMNSKEHAEHGYRTILGVLRLEKSYGPKRLEAACARANAVGALNYGSIKSILARNLDGAALQPELPALPVHENVRGAGYYGREATCAN